MNIEWRCKKFCDLATDELYAVLKLRSEVFVVEQHCVFQDMDDKDQQAEHLMGWTDGKLVAYARLFAAFIAYREASIGRVVTAAGQRGRGLGKLLMLKSIDTCTARYGKQPIRIGGQYHLKKFYESFGFKQAGDPYTEDGIDHIEMLLIL